MDFAMSRRNWRVEKVASPAAWAELAPRWNALLAGSRSRSVFLTWEWLSAWAETYLGPNRRFWILTVERGDELVGIAPWYLERTRIFPFRLLKFLGTPEGGSDHLDVFAEPGAESAVAEALAAYLFGSAEWDALWLSMIPSESPFLVHWSRICEAGGRQAETTITSHAPVLRLPKTEADLESDVLPPRRLGQLRQHSRRLAEVPGVEKVRYKDGEAAEHLDEFFDLYKRKGIALCDRPERLRELLGRFLGKIGGESGLRMDGFRAADRLVAAHISLTYGRTTSWLFNAVDKNFRPTISLGRLLIWDGIRGAVRENFEAFDFLRGREAFKFQFAGEARALCQLVSGRTRAAHFGLSAVRTAKGWSHVLRGA